MHTRGLIIAALVFCAIVVICGQKPCNVLDYHAKGNGIRLDTKDIQRAIDDCDVVYFPPGTYKTGTLYLHSNLTLNLDPNATILGSPLHIRHGALILATYCNNMIFTGGGTIDGGGRHRDEYKLLNFTSCSDILFRNFTIHQTAHDWCFLCQNCSNLEMDHFHLHGLYGRDGLDLVGCNNVAIHHSVILGNDDALALKSNTTIDSDEGQAFNTNNITVWDCVISSLDDNAMQFGSETPGNFSNVSFRNIMVFSAGKAGIGITSNDGGHIENVTFANIVMTNITTPIWIKLTNRTTPVGTIKNVSISNVTATNVIGYNGNFTSTLDGFDPDHLLGPNIVIENIKFNYLGGGSLCAVDITPPDPDTDYRPRYLGDRPSYGFYIRHAQGVTLRNVSVTFDGSELRPAYFLNNADNVMLDNISAERIAGTLCNCDVVIENCSSIKVANSNVVVEEFENIPPCPHEVYYYNPYD